MSARGVTLGEITLSLCASLGAVLAAIAAWKAAWIVVDRYGLDAWRPLVPIVFVFLALTALQAIWNRVEAFIRSSSRRGHH